MNQDLDDGGYPFNWATRSHGRGRVANARLKLGDRNPDGSPIDR